jgi:hypothetical protein
MRSAVGLDATIQITRAGPGAKVAALEMITFMEETGFGPGLLTRTSAGARFHLCSPENPLQHAIGFKV